jgi:hypothetical protein
MPAGREEAAHELAAIFRSVARELELARQIGMRIEQSLCGAADAWAVDNGRVRDLQELDGLIQRLAALRDLFGAADAAQQDPSLAFQAALQHIPLEEMRARLSGACSAPATFTREVEIF